MTNITAKLSRKGKHFEILVDMDSALKLRNGQGSITSALLTQDIFSNLKEGSKVPKSELKEIFATEDVFQVAEKIIKEGELLLPQDYRDEQREQKLRQVIDFLVRNAVDQRNLPYTPDRLKSALNEAGVSIQNKPIDQQIPEILEKLRPIIPIKLEVKKLKLIIPAVHTGKAYGVLAQYKESENWLSNGDLECTVSIPAGLQSEFYDKINSVTHGSIISQEIK